MVVIPDDALSFDSHYLVKSLSLMQQDGCAIRLLTA
jgi:hypothetical protein